MSIWEMRSAWAGIPARGGTEAPFLWFRASVHTPPCRRRSSNPAEGRARASDRPGAGGVGDALGHCEVRAADQRLMLGDQCVERAVAQADRSVWIRDGLVAALVQHRQQALHTGTTRRVPGYPLPDLDCDVMDRPRGFVRADSLERYGEQRYHAFVVASRQRDVALTLRAPVDTCRSARPRPAFLGQPLITRLQQAGRRQPVEVERRQRPTDRQRLRRFLAAQRPTLGIDPLMLPTVHWVVEQSNSRDAVLSWRPITLPDGAGSPTNASAGEFGSRVAAPWPCDRRATQASAGDDRACVFSRCRGLATTHRVATQVLDQRRGQLV